MKKIFLFIVALVLNLSAWAIDFKVGDAKYEVLTDQTVRLKENKKATGDFVIPTTVTDPKTKKEYTVTALGKEAFKKSNITSVLIPKTITNIEEGVFKNCEMLSKVKWDTEYPKIEESMFSGCKSLKEFDFTPIKTIGIKAFRGAGLEALLLSDNVEKVDKEAFLYCSGLKKVIISRGENTHPLILTASDFFGDPIETLVINRPFIYDSTGENYNSVNKPFNNNPALKTIFIGKEFSQAPKNLIENCPGLEKIIFETDAPNKTYRDMLTSIMYVNPVHRYEVERLCAQFYEGEPKLDMFSNPISMEGFVDGKMYYLNKNRYREPEENRIYKYQPCKVYFDAKYNDGNWELDSDEEYNAPAALERVYEGEQKLKFLAKFKDFRTIATTNPENLYSIYSKIEPEEAMKYNDEVINELDYLCDSVYFVKPTLNCAELHALQSFVNNYFMGIGATHKVANCDLSWWAYKDLLNKDLKYGLNKDRYARVLECIDQLFKYETKSSDPYHQAMQLAALCGLERWKEAAEYFPKVHRAVTENGKYLEPNELKYMQTAINQHGFKAVAPSYAQKTSKGKASAKSSGKSNGSLLEFFVDRAIKAGVRHYENKKAEKRARELYYRSIGLDKKGRPLKK